MFTQPLPVHSLLKKKKTNKKNILPFSLTPSCFPSQNPEIKQHEPQHCCDSLIIDFWTRGTEENAQICTIPLIVRSLS